jgi:hypothetical protein
MSRTSLNGGQTRPLTEHGRAALRRILEEKYVPTVSLNVGVVDRLHRGGYIKEVQYLSPFKVHKGGTCPHVKLTEAGMEEANKYKSKQ